MSKFKVNVLFVFDKTEERPKPITYYNASFIVANIGTCTVKNEITIINEQNEVVRDLPINFKIVAFNDGKLIYFPNVFSQEGKFICENGTVYINGKFVETPLIIKHHFGFLKDNGIEFKKEDFQ